MTDAEGMERMTSKDSTAMSEPHAKYSGYIVECGGCNERRKSIHVCEYMMCPFCKVVTRVRWKWAVVGEDPNGTISLPNPVIE